MIYEDLGLFFLELIASVLLLILADYASKVYSSKWKLCYLISFLICMLAIGFFGFEISMLGVYVGSVIVAIGFFKESKKIRKIVSIISLGMILLSGVVCNIYSGYRKPDYVEDFKNAFVQLKTHYVLSEHKKIDWKALYEKYLPLFEKADSIHDEVEIHKIWNAFVREFHDGHVSYSTKDKEVLRDLEKQILGNDYGLSLMTLYDGRTVAVNVEQNSELTEAGIRNGTQILAWDGKKVDTMLKENLEDTPFVPNATKENEQFYRAMMLAGKGNDMVNITFLDDRNEEKSVTIHKIGCYANRLEDTWDIVNQGVEISNLEWQNLDSKTALMRMRFMAYDAKENLDELEENLRNTLIEKKQEGITHLIFDLRNNAGGSGAYVKCILKLLAPEGQHVYAYDGVFEKETMKYKKDATTDQYIVGECEKYEGENLWSHGNIVVLVNAMTISAGDHFTKLASEFPNVTVMGFTHSNCSAQGIQGISFDYGELSYSAVLLLNEDGTVFVDTDYTRTSTVPLDIQIPFDDNAVKMLFDDKTDYVLEYAKNYLK